MKSETQSKSGGKRYNSLPVRRTLLSPRRMKVVRGFENLKESCLNRYRLRNHRGIILYMETTRQLISEFGGFKLERVFVRYIGVEYHISDQQNKVVAKFPFESAGKAKRSFRKLATN